MRIVFIKTNNGCVPLIPQGQNGFPVADEIQNFVQRTFGQVQCIESNASARSSGVVPLIIASGI